MLVQKKQHHHQKNNQGIALILSIFILSNLFIISFVVADIIIRIGKTGHGIGQSESAYLATETAIEKTIYAIEANRDITQLGTMANPDTGDMDYTNGSWSRYANVITKLALTCVDGSQKITYPAQDPDDGEHSCIYSEIDNQDITNSNVFKVHLQDGRSFQLELDITGIDYPNFLTVSWQNKRPGQVIALDLEEDAGNIQTIYDTDGIKQFDLPKSGSLNGRQRFKITNKSGEDIIYTIKPSLSDYALPIGILIHTQGEYSNTHERILEVERRNWQMY
ncbi:MAG: hypothetical protein ABIJ91_05145 [Candidatus Kuenenbacteria bacterium]